MGPAPRLALYAGSYDLLENHRSAVIITQVAPRIFPAVCFCLVGVLGVVLLPLWFNDRKRRELLLLTLACVALPPIYLDYTGAAALFPFSVSAYFVCWALFAAAANVTRALFFFALVRRRVPLVFWFLIVVGNGLYIPTFIAPCCRLGRPFGSTPCARDNLRLSATFFGFSKTLRLLPRSCLGEMSQLA